MIIKSKTSDLTVYTSRDIHGRKCISVSENVSKEDIKALATLVFSVANQNLTDETMEVIIEPIGQGEA